VVASWAPHFGEEPVISCRQGSGTVFFANCNLRCVFCQNHDISQRSEDFAGRSLPAGQLAGIEDSIRWVADTMSPKIAISLLAQYRPAHRVAHGHDHPELGRRINSDEWHTAVQALRTHMEGDRHHVQGVLI
jgi:uncharacterized Fe-S radical SAM superfamily protein PflX